MFILSSPGDPAPNDALSWQLEMTWMKHIIQVYWWLERLITNWLVVEPTHLKNISQNGFIFPKQSDKNKTYLKPLVLDQVLYQLFLGKVRKSLQSSVSTSVWDFKKKQLHTKYRHLMEGFFFGLKQKHARFTSPNYPKMNSWDKTHLRLR